MHHLVRHDGDPVTLGSPSEQFTEKLSIDSELEA